MKNVLPDKHRDKFTQFNSTHFGHELRKETRLSLELHCPLVRSVKAKKTPGQPPQLEGNVSMMDSALQGVHDLNRDNCSK
ncbi:phospholipid-translocating P-type ATPase domain-containing protein [Aspergillus luchuensis]|uniref:Phospholipid-translocating P-type ATPase domain-containing protein n=1 Tax=Aspergillus kawachii TaxID=1069201 RepID=A0A146FCG9_ASPKA|nr:phospholipid-translocating P-type ATPase domain-containing protein [Aspergillus luchuensis]